MSAPGERNDMSLHAGGVDGLDVLRHPPSAAARPATLRDVQVVGRRGMSEPNRPHVNIYMCVCVCVCAFGVGAGAGGLMVEGRSDLLRWALSRGALPSFGCGVPPADRLRAAPCITQNPNSTYQPSCFV